MGDCAARDGDVGVAVAIHHAAVLWITPPHTQVLEHVTAGIDTHHIVTYTTSNRGQRAQPELLLVIALPERVMVEEL